MMLELFARHPWMVLLLVVVLFLAGASAWGPVVSWFDSQSPELWRVSTALWAAWSGWHTYRLLLKQ